MHRGVFAFDFDGTIAEHGQVPDDLCALLEQMSTEGSALFLVTGRRAESLDLGELRSVFTGIVWENGAVLQHIETDEFLLPFGALDSNLVARLEATGAGFEHGRAILATSTEHEPSVRRVIDEWGGDAVVVHNKGAVMILPPGAAKGAGLDRMLAICGFSPRNLVSFGDGENDLSLLGLADIGVAVADAVPALLAAADLVSNANGPAGVADSLRRYWGDSDSLEVEPRHLHPILLGSDSLGVAVSISCRDLATGSLGVFGDSASGKSFVAGLLAEGMHHAGYQVIIIDPEGDHRGLRTLPGFVAIDADADGELSMPPAFVCALLEMANVSVVLDLCSVETNARAGYIADLLRRLRLLRTRRFRPHWILLEEAQHVLIRSGGEVEAELAALTAEGGTAIVSYCPDRLPSTVLRTLDHLLLTPLSDPNGIASVRLDAAGPLGDGPLDIDAGEILICDRRRRVVVRLRPLERRVPHVRHLRKYLHTPLPWHKRFRFRVDAGPTGIEAASLLEFSSCLRTITDESLTYHSRRGDFAIWAAGSLGDELLASQLRSLGERSLPVAELRAALVQLVSHRCDELAEFG